LIDRGELVESSSPYILTMKEIGSQMGLTESGVCRVHSGALRHLRIELKRIEDGGSSASRPKNLRKTLVSDE